MQTVAGFKRKLDAFDFEASVYQALEETKEFHADLNVEQLNKGMRANNTTMPDYSRNSVEFYGKPDGPIKLFDTGAFYRGFFAEVRKTGVYSFSTDPKADFLQKDYSKYIFGLGSAYKSEYIGESLQPALNRLRKQALGI